MRVCACVCMCVCVCGGGGGETYFVFCNNYGQLQGSRFKEERT